MENKNIIKYIERLKLVNRIKPGNAEFFPALLKFFHRKEGGDFPLGVEGKVNDVVLSFLYG